MGYNSWNPFAAPHSPSRRSSYRPGYASSSYSSSSRHHSSTSRYKRSPRDSYMQHLYKKLQHFLREIWRYAQRHPYKVFFMIIMPLVSGGVLHKLARQFGVNLPEMGGAGHAAGRGGFSGSGHHAASSGGYYGSQGYGRETSYESRNRNTNTGGGMAGMMGGIDMQSVAGGIGGLASLARTAENILTITRVVGNLTEGRFSNGWSWSLPKRSKVDDYYALEPEEARRLVYDQL